MTSKIQKFAKTISYGVEKIFNARGMVYPMIHYVTADGRHEVAIVTPGHTKDEAAAAIRAILKERNAVMVAFIHEAWTLDAATSADPVAVYRKYGGLEKAPGRKEVVAFTLEDIDGGCLQGSREIVRPTGHHPYLAALETFEPSQSEGRFVGLLPTRGTAS